MAQTSSWLTYYFHKVKFLNVISLFFNLQHNEMHQIKVIHVYLLIYQPTLPRRTYFRTTENVR